jgi:hypothetical protein
MRTEYHERLVSYFRQTIPEFTGRYEPPVLRELVAQGEQKAGDHGLTTPEGIVRFIGLSIIIGPQFCDEPNTKLFLSLPELDADRKLELLCRLVARRLQASGVE